MAFGYGEIRADEGCSRDCEAKRSEKNTRRLKNDEIAIVESLKLDFECPIFGTKKKLQRFYLFIIYFGFGNICRER